MSISAERDYRGMFERAYLKDNPKAYFDRDKGRYLQRGLEEVWQAFLTEALIQFPDQGEA